MDQESSEDHLNTLDLLFSLRNVVPLKSSPLDNYNDYETLQRFRFTKDGIFDILHLIGAQLSVGIGKASDIPPLVQLLITLRFLASGSFQNMVGDLHFTSQPGVSKVIKRVCTAIAKLRYRYVVPITFENTDVERRKFRNIAGFPGVIGAIDCTHIKINSPGGDQAELFRNRKSWFSLNVQAVCDADGFFTNVVARWPGSVHDSRIFNNSHLLYQLENNLLPGLLLGDSGYPVLPILLTPLENPVTAAEKRFNRAQIRTRNVIERSFGVLKRRFFCLGGGLRYKLCNCYPIIIACFVLHNIAKKTNTQEPEHEPHNVLIPEIPALPVLIRTVGGNALRQTIIQTHFA